MQTKLFTLQEHEIEAIYRKNKEANVSGNIRDIIFYLNLFIILFDYFKNYGFCKIHN